MSACTVSSVGYRASERATIAYGSLYRPGGTKRPIIFAGSGGDDREFLSAVVGGHIPVRLVDIDGVVCAGAELGGGLLWGNDTVQTAIGQLWAYVKSRMGTKADKFVGVGISKGATAMANYMRSNPGNVAAFVGMVPAMDVSAIHDSSRPFVGAGEIDAAYPSGGWAANKATHDPALNTATHASQAIPSKLIYGDADTTVKPGEVEAFAAAVGPSVQLQKIGGGGHATTCPLVDPVEDVLKFVAPYI